jgi:hypothetical protein
MSPKYLTSFRPGANVDTFCCRHWTLEGPVAERLGVRSRKLSYVGQSLDDQKFIISSSSVLRKARYAVEPGCICSP